MVILTGGEPYSDNNYNYPMFSNLFKGEGLAFFFNKIICMLAELKKLPAHIDEQNEFTCTLSKAMPDQVLNTYWANPLENNCLEKIKIFYQNNGFKMIKLHQCWTKFDVTSETCQQIFEWSNENKIPVFIHLISREQVKKFAYVANNFPETVFIVAHMIGSKSMRARLKNKNIFFDLSAPQLYSVEILKKAIKAYGTDRLLLGSDNPYGNNNVEKILKRLKKLQLSEQDLRLICGENIKKLLLL